MRLALHWQILIGMIFGLVVGAIAVSFEAQGFVTDWIKPFGQIFINSLKLIAIAQQHYNDTWTRSAYY